MDGTQGDSVVPWNVGSFDLLDDGRELYYSSQDGQLMAVEIATNPEFKPGKPQPLGFSAGDATWDCTADGRRFLVAAPKMAPKSKGPEPYTVILNWQAGLTK